MQKHFKNRESWRRWLEKNHDACDLLWMVFYKKHTGKVNVAYGEAVEEALCFGWIDSLIKRLDDDRYARKFTPRTDVTRWSESNLKRVRKMIAAGRMTGIGLAKMPPGIKPLPAVSDRPLEPPPFFTEALKKNPAAGKFFDGLAPSYRRNYIHWVGSAKREETRQRRLKEAISLLSEGRKLGMK